MFTASSTSNPDYGTERGRICRAFAPSNDYIFRSYLGETVRTQAAHSLRYTCWVLPFSSMIIPFSETLIRHLCTGTIITTDQCPHTPIL